MNPKTMMTILAAGLLVSDRYTTHKTGGKSKLSSKERKALAAKKKKQKAAKKSRRRNR